MKKILLLTPILFLLVLIVLATDIDRGDGLVNVSYSGSLNLSFELVNISIPRYSTINTINLDLTGIFNISDDSKLCTPADSFAGLSYNDSSFFIMWKGSNSHGAYNIQSYDLTSCSSTEGWNISWSSVTKPGIMDMFDFNGTDMWILNQSGGSLHKTDFPSNPITPIKTHIIDDIDCFQWVDDTLWTTNTTHLRQHSKTNLLDIDKSFGINITTACLDMTWDGNRFWISDWNSGGGDDRIYALDIDNTTMVYNKTSSTAYYITYNNTDVIYGDGSSDIYNFDGKGGFPINITVKTNNIKVYENLTELNGVGMNNINLDNNSALQNCIDTCTNQDGVYCICPINISSDYSGKANYTINISYYPYSWSYASGTHNELTNQQYGLTVPRLPNSTDLSDVDAILEFDGTLYTSSVALYSDRYVFNKTIISNIGTITKTIPHHWIFNKSYTNTTLELFAMNNQTQNFQQLLIGLCGNATFNVSVLNITLQDEETLSNLSSDLDVAFENIYVNNIYYPLNISFNFSGIANVSFCLNTNYTTRFDAIFVYTSSGYTQRIYNFLENLTYLSTYFLDLYLSNDGNLTNIYATLYDENSERLSDYYVKADRFYPHLSDYRNIETVKSDINGEVLLHLIPFTKEYRLRIIDFDGNIVKIIPRTTIKSSTITITVPTEEGYLQNYDAAIGASHSLTFDNDTKEVVWQSTTTNFPQSCLSVVRMTAGGKLLYNNCKTGTTVIDAYTITEDTSEQAYVFRGYFKKSNGEIVGGDFKEHTEVTTSLRFGDIGLLITIVIFITLFMIGIHDPAVAIFLSALGLVISFYIGFISLAIGTIILVVIMVGYLLYKMKT